MNLGEEKYVRFEECDSEKSFSLNSTPRRGLIPIRKPRISSIMDVIRSGVSRSSKRLKSLRNWSLHGYYSPSNKPAKPTKRTKILDPQEPFLQRWNKIFVLACIVAISLDPLFFYIPVVDGERRCLSLDKRLQIIACVLRTFIDFFYVFHIYLQFRTGFIARYTMVFGRGELIVDPKAIAKRYLSFYFIIDTIGAIWYMIAVERQDRCWRRACRHHGGCNLNDLYCGGVVHGNTSFLNSSCPLLEPDKITSPNEFDFGIFLDALQSQVVEHRDFPKKLLYCFWWGLRNLSSLGQNLKTSTFVGEILFAIFISIVGLVLFSLLIGNMQKYLQSITVRVEEMRVKRRDAEQWMSHRMLPEDLRARIRRYEQYKWQQNRGVEEYSLIRNLPKDLRRDIKRHLCWTLLTRVPMFQKMNEQLLDAMCHHLKPILYTKDSYIVREGDPVDEMLFIMRGKIFTMTTNGGQTGFFNSTYLMAGDFCGEELLTWALDPNSSTTLPISTRTVRAVKDVEAFCLMPEDLKSVASQFRRLFQGKQLQHIFRRVFLFYSSFDKIFMSWL
ncbi:cyclic nucleotide gated channel 1 [Striga asiatica]|uniref:Cyclic nucleotide gated channel 1 n=1 Tax=Striga asiatica TaxID=4170 RepID=A0A5A7P106_STRAF|nr:cyclic nucleotide gated channel 1 [Striga asiatica]